MLYILTIIPLDVTWLDILKKLRKVLIFIRVSPRDMKKIVGKTTVKYNERLKRILLMTRKNNVAMRELNDNIDHKNVVII